MGASESLWYVRMNYELLIDRGSSPQSVSDSVEAVLEFRVLGEGARVIGILLYRAVSRRFIVIIRVRVRVRVGGGKIVIITAGAEVNTKSDGDGYNGSYSETRQDELGLVWDSVSV